VKSAVHVFLGYGDHQAEVGFHQSFLARSASASPCRITVRVCLNSGRWRRPWLRVSAIRVSIPARVPAARGVPGFELLDLAIEVVDFIHSAIDFAEKLLPFDEPERNAANRQGGLHFGAIQLGAQPLAGLLVGGGRTLNPVLQLLELLVEGDHIGEPFGRVSPDLEIGGEPSSTSPRSATLSTSMVAFFN